VRRSDRIIGVHSEIERTACACRPREEEDHARMEATRHLGHAVVPDLVARDVERRCAVGKTQPAVNVEPTPLTLF
jgi:hypothetical protein